jgi:predicted PurR-regulated permease PerM
MGHGAVRSSFPFTRSNREEGVEPRHCRGPYNHGSDAGNPDSRYFRHDFRGPAGDLKADGGVEGIISRNRIAATAFQWTKSHVDWDNEMKELRSGVGDRLGRTLGGAVWTVMNALACVFLLFYFFRDRDKAVGLVKFLIPASAKESDQLLKQVRDMIRSTLHGTLFVSAIQGLLGGLMFWFLGIPGALLWGVAMGLLSVVPILGAFVVWVPAAAFLAVQGEWMKAGILALWGVLVVGLIDNLLYPMLVGEQTRMHTVPMFLALLGGLAVFGAAGLVIGPIVLAFTWSLLQLLRKRMILHGEVLDRPTE